MAILVEEGLRPDGTDLVVGEHRFNPQGIAKAHARPVLKLATLDLGEDFQVSQEIRIISAIDGEDLCFVLSIFGGKSSLVAGAVGGPMILGEIGRIPIADLKARIASAMEPKETPVE